MKSLFLAMISVMTLALVVSGGKAFAGDSGGFCRSDYDASGVCSGVGD